jgi:hypothetical protein
LIEKLRVSTKKWEFFNSKLNGKLRVPTKMEILQEKVIGKLRVSTRNGNSSRLN